MSLRLRLALSLLLAAVPVMGVLAWQHRRVERTQAREALVQFAHFRLDEFARARCEADPERFPPPPGPPLARGPRERAGPPHAPREAAPGAIQFWTYSPDFESANPFAPPFPEELRAALSHGATSADARLGEGEHERLAVGVRMPWNTGPCAVVLVLRHGPLPPSFAGAFLENALLLTLAMLGAVLLAAGPIVARVRRLSREVRESAARSYARPVEVSGNDEVGELAAAFNAAGAEVHTHVAALEARERALRDFVANTTHDVMLPLTVLQGHLTALKKRLESRPGELEVLRDALEEAHYLTSLVQNLGAAARLESGVVELHRRPLVLDELVERVLARHRPIALQKEITLEHALPGEPLTVEADVTLLEQAVSNVLHNAVRYGRPGGRVLVSLEERGPDGFSLRVLDDGPGIPAQELARLGERSWRSDAARSRHPDGLGLGLSIAHEVARRHGFTLELRGSEPGGLEVEFSGPRRGA